jgi:hypothetical protein
MCEMRDDVRLQNNMIIPAYLESPKRECVGYLTRQARDQAQLKVNVIPARFA